MLYSQPVDHSEGAFLNYLHFQNLTLFTVDNEDSAILVFHGFILS